MAPCVRLCLDWLYASATLDSPQRLDFRTIQDVSDRFQDFLTVTYVQSKQEWRMTEGSNFRPSGKTGVAMHTPTEDGLLDLGLLVLRRGAGLCLRYRPRLFKLGERRGWEYGELVRSVGSPAGRFLLFAPPFSESAVAALVACGLCTRPAAATVTFNMLVPSYADLKHRSSMESAWISTGLPSLRSYELAQAHFPWTIGGSVLPDETSDQTSPGGAGKSRVTNEVRE